MAKIDKNSKQVVTPSIFDIPDTIIPEDMRLYYPDWSNQPPNASPLISFNSKRVLACGNILTIVSQPAVGKTQVLGSLVSVHLNPKCDAFGFRVTTQGTRNKILYIDAEQSPQDTWINWHKIMRRAGIEKPKLDKRVIVVNMKSISISLRKKMTEEIMKENPEIGIVMFDGAGDYVKDVNSIVESTDIIEWLNTFNPNIGIVASLHTNPPSKDSGSGEKPRGHIGSEMCRRSESVILIKKHEGGLRELTTDFQYGKVRADNDQLTSWFRYDEDIGLFVSTAEMYKAIREDKLSADIGVLQEAFKENKELGYTVLIKRIAESRGISEHGGRKVLEKTLERKVLKKMPNGLYQIALPEE